MIEGLKVTIAGPELRELCAKHAAHHREREKVYGEQIDGMKAAKVEGMNYSHGDPVKALEDKMAEHRSSAEELEFIASHIDISETYRLQRDDLFRIGIVGTTGRW